MENILDAYITKYPSSQNILDMFAGEWSSKVPVNAGVSDPGKALLFDDIRISWAEQTFGSFSGTTVLELGPLEGGHTYMMHQRGAEKIIAIDANTRSFLKCLCIKEIFNLNRAQFMLGDFNAYLDTCTEKFDTIVASGVLYHMMEPLQLLRNLAKVGENVFIWTHYYDANVIKANKNLDHKFGKEMVLELDGHKYDAVEHIYADSLNWSGFCGGPNIKAIWLTKESLMRCLRNYGFSVVLENFEDLQHGSGPAISICAMKS